jgi:hypothetical protein
LVSHQRRGGNNRCQERRESLPVTVEAERLALHAWSVRNLPGAGQAALCPSGGGIRSAAYALKIFRGLARKKLLQKLHYVSTV